MYSKITLDFFFKLLTYAQSLKVEMSTKAERMIHGYYLASRRVRTSVSVTSIGLL